MAALALGPVEPELQPGLLRVPLGSPRELPSVDVYRIPDMSYPRELI